MASFLSDNNVIKLKRIESNKFKITVHLLSGSNPTFVEEEIEAEFKDLNDLPFEGHVYIVKSDINKWIDIDPYFKYTLCKECQHYRFLIHDGNQMIDPYVGHRTKI